MRNNILFILLIKLKEHGMKRENEKRKKKSISTIQKKFA